MKIVILWCFLLIFSQVSFLWGMQKLRCVTGLNEKGSETSAYYMAALAGNLSIEMVEGFSGSFKGYKRDFLALLQAKDLYAKDSCSICQYALQRTGITASVIATEAYLLLLPQEHKQIIMQKLMYACASEGHEATARLLLVHDVDLQVSKDALSFLEVANLCNNKRVCKLLRKKEKVHKNDNEQACYVQ